MGKGQRLESKRARETTFPQGRRSCKSGSKGILSEVILSLRSYSGYSLNRSRVRKGYKTGVRISKGIKEA